MADSPDNIGDLPSFQPHWRPELLNQWHMRLQVITKVEPVVLIVGIQNVALNGWHLNLLNVRSLLFVACVCRVTSSTSHL